MANQNRVSKAKQGVTRVINQAKESLRLLGTLEKETIAKAKTLVRIPNAAERKQLTNDKILSSLRKLGVATHADVEALNSKVRKLESALQKGGKSSSGQSKLRTKSATN